MLTEFLWSDVLQGEKSLMTPFNESPLVILVNDAFLEKLFVEEFLKKNKETERLILIGSDINEDIIENIFALDLFSGKEEYFIFMAELISPSQSDLLLQYLKKNSSELKKIYFFFKKECRLFKELKKLKKRIVEIKAPNFWEFEKVLTVLLKRSSLYLSEEDKDYFIKSVELNLADYVKSINLLSQEQAFLKNNNLNLENIKILIPQKRLDQFLMAHLFGKNRHQEFFRRLVILNLNHTELEDFFRFMQGHLLKLLDCLGATPTTKYEKEMRSYRNLWSREKLISKISMFSQWQIVAKEKLPELYHLINRELYLEKSSNLN